VVPELELVYFQLEVFRLLHPVSGLALGLVDFQWEYQQDFPVEALQQAGWLEGEGVAPGWQIQEAVLAVS